MTAVQPPVQDQNRPASPDGAAGPGYVTGIADGNLQTPMRLRDYLSGVGVVFRLPRRNRKEEEREAAAEAERKKFRLRLPVRQIAMVLAPAALAIVGYYAWDAWLSTVPLPAEVNGTWSTNDGKYAGRNFWINQKAVAFQNGKSSQEFSIHPIKRIKTRQSGDSLYLSVDYTESDKPITLTLVYTDHPMPEIRLANQPKIRWLKTGSSPVISQ